jgi:hypothetical protein
MCGFAGYQCDSTGRPFDGRYPRIVQLPGGLGAVDVPPITPNIPIVQIDWDKLLTFLASPCVKREVVEYVDVFWVVWICPGSNTNCDPPMYLSCSGNKITVTCTHLDGTQEKHFMFEAFVCSGPYPDLPAAQAGGMWQWDPNDGTHPDIPTRPLVF